MLNKCLISTSLVLLLSQPSFAGMLWTTTEIPGGLGDQQTVATKKGTAYCSTLFHLVSWGKCGLNTAKEQGGLDKIYYYDISYFNMLLGWIYKQRGTTVYGE